MTNQFGALGTAKPGLFRRLVLRVALLGLDYAARHVYKRGHLTRVSTIHFARWVYLDGKRRILFASNYDGSLESYMDDFINKVGWGLNIVFSNGVGYPRTDYLVEGRRLGRAEVQALHPPARAGDGGVVQRAPRVDGSGSRAEHEDPPGSRGDVDERCAGPRMAAAALMEA